jgi:hypothetical protein
VHVLPVGQHHHDQDHRDGERDLPGDGQRRQPGDREGQEDLVRGVRDRRQRVAGEHREGDALGQQGLTQLGAAQFAPEQQPFADIA